MCLATPTHSLFGAWQPNFSFLSSRRPLSRETNSFVAFKPVVDLALSQMPKVFSNLWSNLAKNCQNKQFYNVLHEEFQHKTITLYSFQIPHFGSVVAIWPEPITTNLFTKRKPTQNFHFETCFGSCRRECKIIRTFHVLCITVPPTC